MSTVTVEEFLNHLRRVVVTVPQYQLTDDQRLEALQEIDNILQAVAKTPANLTLSNGDALIDELEQLHTRSSASNLRSKLCDQQRNAAISLTGTLRDAVCLTPGEKSTDEIIDFLKELGKDVDGGKKGIPLRIEREQKLRGYLDSVCEDIEDRSDELANLNRAKTVAPELKAKLDLARHKVEALLRRRQKPESVLVRFIGKLESDRKSLFLSLAVLAAVPLLATFLLVWLPQRLSGSDAGSNANSLLPGHGSNW